ncbi:MAG: hypothetical protein L0271_21420 [Gemmatimonadetes bacterium]|nr:hypothetical protein [Gemmatimonadota bacterium]
MLTELIVVMVVMGIIGAAMTGLMVSQSRFFNDQEGQASARRVARAGTSMLLADLRMVEPGGILAAAPDSFTILVPYRLGVICGAAGGLTAAALQPVDSVVSAEAGYSGFAFIDSTNAVRYVGAAPTVGAGGVATCIAQGVDTIPGGRVVVIASTPAGANPGSPILMLQRLTYAIRPSTAVPGRRGLYRRVVDLNRFEELTAPLDTTATFRYFTSATAAPVTNPSPLSSVIGVQLELVGYNERQGVAQGRTQRAPLLTSVFFENR